MIQGVGYNSKRRYKAIVDGERTIAYMKWRLMLKRCYSKETHKHNPSYITSSVCELWHDYQNFAEWHYDNYYEVPGHVMHLDKDILGDGDLYSPDTCIYIPDRINYLFEGTNIIRELPIGVYKRGNGKFGAKYGTKWLGSFNTIDEAFNRYKWYKELVIKSYAYEYKDYLPTKVFNSLINYEVISSRI